MKSNGFQTLSTNDVPEHIRMDKWNKFCSETFSSIEVKPEDPREFSAQISRIQIGCVGLSWYATTAATGKVEVGRVGDWSAPVRDAFLLTLQEAGDGIGHHMGREIVSKAGDWALLDATRPWQIFSPGPMKNVTLKLPADRVLGLLKDPAATCGVRFDAHAPKLALAASLLLSIKDAIAANPHEAWDEPYEDLLLGIVATVLSSAQVASSTVSGLSLRRKAFALIEEHLKDPDLDVGLIAAALGTSTRTVQRIFLAIGYTPRRYILERRLAVAAEHLRRISDKNLSITEIAFAVGFNDLSYFTRSFQKKMGVSPREYRANPASAHPDPANRPLSE